jgi:ribulose-phosphate 3-epimerase
MNQQIEIIPAILKRTFEDIERDWNIVRDVASHIQIDITDGIFAGNDTFREIPRFKQLVNSNKIEMHMMVHKPSYYVDNLIDLSPARIVFHLEAFAGSGDLISVYQKMRASTQSELALAINPNSPNERLNDFLELLDYVMFLGVDPGYSNQPFDQGVYQKIGAFRKKCPQMPIAIDGHVNKETINPLVKAGANMLCINTAIFKGGDPLENIQQLKLLALSTLEN